MISNNFFLQKKFNLYDHKALVIAARVNNVVVSKLIAGAFRAFSTAKIKEKNQEIIRVDGALELPLALKAAVLSNRFDIFVVLGAVIKGQTDHYEHVCRLAHDGILTIAIKNNLALGNGILTVHNLEHALMRAGEGQNNLGYSAALAAINLSVIFFELLKRKQ